MKEERIEVEEWSKEGYEKESVKGEDVVEENEDKRV